MSNQNKYRKLYLDDLQDLPTFKRWIQDSISWYNDEAPYDHLLIYLDYIRNIVRDSTEIDHQIFFEAITNLERQAEAIQRGEE